MAIFRGEIRSRTMEMDTGLAVILPYDSFQELPPAKTLYLLHGLKQSAGAWLNMSSIGRYAKEHNLAVVMPEVQRSFYTDMEMGLAYFTYISEELPQLCQKLFRLSPKREDTFVAGLSMGGYGAAKCALARPDIFSAFGSFSGALDIAMLKEGAKYAPQMLPEMQAIFGTDLVLKEQDDLFALAQKAAALPKEMRPRAYITCGSDDHGNYIIEQNRKFRDHLSALPLELRYEEFPGGHEWPLWDKSVERAIPFFLGE